jgi:hypothetical protein
MAIKEGSWLPILEYSQFKKVSISTVRRHIKSNLVKWKDESGKYFVWTPVDTQEIEERKEGQLLAARLELQRLVRENRMLREELEEARMLIRLYESPVVSPPEVPYT